jgi:outer membrane lipoprotein carrier protein
VIRLRIACTALFAIVTLLPVAHSQQSKDDLSKLAGKVDKHYNQLQSMRAEFTESYQGPGISRTESGTLWLKQPGQMRWEYSQPRKKLFVSDGKRAWFYVPGEQQARKTSVNKLDDLRSPLRFLLGKTKLLKEFNDLRFDNRTPLTAGNSVLRGAPKGMEDRVASVALEVTPNGRIDWISIEEIDGSRTEFRFSNEVENLQMANSLFRFEPPSGVEIVEAKELGN